MSKNSLVSPSCIVNIQCSAPSASSNDASSFILNRDPETSMMSTTTNNLSSNSYGFISSQSGGTCNICERLLYEFEEILICRICQGVSHWRCVKPQTVSYYGEHENFVCDACTGQLSINSSSQRSNARIKSPDSLETSYRHFVHVPPKSNGTVHTDAIRYLEGKQQQQQQQLPTTSVSYRRSDYDEYLLSPTRGQSTEDNHIHRRNQQQSSHSNGLDSDEEHQSSTMFQANYQYTPLKEYAATRTGATTTTNTNGIVETSISNGYRNSPPNGHHRSSPPSRYGGGLHYNNHGYDPITSRIVESPPGPPTSFTSPTIDNLSLHNRRTQFISTTNLNVNEQPSHHSQVSLIESNNNLAHSSPYLAQTREHDGSILKGSLQVHSDQNSAVGSDSGIVMVNAQPNNSLEENQFVEKKLTDLVHQLGKQLETDAQKINEKLESKLKGLEDMIHQQTYIIRRQDEVIERLKSKILKIENERDHFRDRLTHHEQEQKKKKNQASMTNLIESQPLPPPSPVPARRDRSRTTTPEHSPTELSKGRKQSTGSSNITETNRPSVKKNPPPPPPTHQEDSRSSIGKLIQSIPLNREPIQSSPPSIIDRLVDENPLLSAPTTPTKPVHPAPSSETPTITSKLIVSNPLVETPAATSRLNHIIHQSENESRGSVDLRLHERTMSEDVISSSQEQVINTLHQDDHRTNPTMSLTRSNSSSSSSSSSLSISPTANKPSTPINITSINVTPSNDRQRNVHGSFESLPHNYGRLEALRATNKTASLDFGMKPVQYDDGGSIYITPVEASQPANQSHASVKGWLRKQNRESIFKRIERYYCVLTNGALLMHRRDSDRRAQKAISLKGAKVLAYEDPKHGPALELTWSKGSKITKHYHLYTLNRQEAQKWADGIQAAIHTAETNTVPPATTSENKWQRYRMNT